MSAILRANYYYYDDLQRAAFGYKGWGDSFSRYMSCWLSNIVHTDTYLADVAPLPQILAIIIMAFAGSVLIYILSDSKKFSAWLLVGAVPLCLCPYYLECMSYRYDAPYMAISVLFSILPLLFYRDGKKGLAIYSLATFAGMLVMCLTYQASSGIFPMLVVCFALKMWIGGDNFKKILCFIGASVVGYIISLGIYRIFIVHPVYTYVTNYQAPVSSLLPTTISNLKTYFSVIIRDYRPIWLVFTGLAMVGFVICCTLNSKRNKWASLAISLLALAVMLCLSFGVYAILELSFYTPRAMYGFGVFTAIITVSVCCSKKALPMKICCAGLAWLFVVFAFLYGNCLNVQAKYTDFRVQMIISDLNDLEEYNNDNLKVIKFSGDIGLSPLIESIPRDNYAMLDNLIPSTFGGNDTMLQTGFFYYYNIPNTVPCNYGIRNDVYDYNFANIDDLPMLKDTVYHTIYGDGESFFIVLK